MDQNFNKYLGSTIGLPGNHVITSITLTPGSVNTSISSEIEDKEGGKFIKKEDKLIYDNKKRQFTITEETLKTSIEKKLEKFKNEIPVHEFVTSDLFKILNYVAHFTYTISSPKVDTDNIIS